MHPDSKFRPKVFKSIIIINNGWAEIVGCCMSENITIINLKCPFNSLIVHTKTDKHLLLIQRILLLS